MRLTLMSFVLAQRVTQPPSYISHRSDVTRSYYNPNPQVLQQVLRPRAVKIEEPPVDHYQSDRNIRQTRQVSASRAQGTSEYIFPHSCGSLSLLAQQNMQLELQFSISSSATQRMCTYDHVQHITQDHTTGNLNSITTQAVALDVLLFPCLITSQLYSIINLARLLGSPFVTFTPATMQHGDRQRSIGKERVENLISIGTVEGALLPM